ncbi:MAG: DUF3078 domain-containing protein [Bacteroidetes bacterium]|nr:DUF3078 domain-containing protein [Bacteroidota bacterium]
MRKLLLLFAGIIFLGQIVNAQRRKSIEIILTKKYKKPAKPEWKKGVSFSLFAGQAGSKNWASGSDIFSLSVNGFMNAYASYDTKRWLFQNNLTASYGMVVTDEFATIKNDDKLDLFSELGRKLNKHKTTLVGAAFNFRSQFSNGYDRNYLQQGLKRRTSGFFAPAYITIAPIGIILHPKHVDIYASPIGFRGVLVSNSPYSYLYQGGVIPSQLINEKNPYAQERSVAEMYGVGPDRTIQYQIGPYVSIRANKEILKNVGYSGRIDLFSDFNHPHPENVDIFWMNTFNFKINNWLNAVYSLDLAYDNDIKKFGFNKDHAALQVKSVLGLGVTAKFSDKRKKRKHRVIIRNIRRN